MKEAMAETTALSAILYSFPNKANANNVSQITA